MNSISEKYKISLERLSAAYEEFNLDDFKTELAFIQKISSETKSDILYNECLMFMSAVNEYGFEGVYAYFQEFIDVITDVINELDG